MSEVHEEFWNLAEEHLLNILTLCQITSAPIKVLLSWRDNETTLQSALDDLKRFLNIETLGTQSEEIIKALQENRISDAQYFILEAEPDLIKIQELINTSK